MEKESIHTGFKMIDDRGGFETGDLVVIGGATSIGKTTLAINILVNSAKTGIPSMFFSLEMTIQQISARIVSNELPIYIDDSANSIEAIKEKIRSMAIKKGVKVFFIDFLQRMWKLNNIKENEVHFYEAVCNELKDLAKKLKVCIVIICQLNRGTNDNNPRPSLSMLPNDIETAPDTIIFIYRPGYYGKRHKYRPDLDPNTTAELIIAKGRNMWTGSSYCHYEPIIGFSEINEPELLEKKDNPVRNIFKDIRRLIAKQIQNNKQ
jgi:replicative DNA helicase